MTEVAVWDKGRPHVFAELVAPDDVDEQSAFAAIAVDAIFALGLFEPLSVDVELACCDVEFGYPLRDPRPAAPFHQVRRAGLPESVAVRQVWTDTRIAERERLDRDGVLDWIGALLAEQQCPDTTSGWTELLVEAVRARLPEGIESDGDHLPTSYGTGVLRFPVERSANALWVAGPLAFHSDSAPFDLRIVNESGALSLDLSLNWSPWIDPDGAGRPDVEAAVTRLTALGWTVTS